MNRRKQSKRGTSEASALTCLLYFNNEAAMEYTEDQRQNIIAESAGKVTDSLEWDSVGKYWVMTFTDGTEVCFRFMSELC